MVPDPSTDPSPGPPAGERFIERWNHADPRPAFLAEHAATPARHRATSDGGEWAALGADLLRRHCEPHRRYHGVAHVLAVLDVIEDLSGAPPTPALVLAAFFHDAIYVTDPTARLTAGGVAPGVAVTNEEASAELAHVALTPVLSGTGRNGAAATLIDDITGIIRATEDHRPRPITDCELFLDADLSILGTPPPVYDRYVGGIRHEYGHVTDADWRSGRSAVLTGFLDRPQLFFTAAGVERFEQVARANITRELDTLG